MSARKPADSRVDKSKTRDFGVVEGGAAAVPEVPQTQPALLKRTREWWESVWRSQIAGSWDRESDLPAVERLAKLHDDRERAVRSYRQEPLVEGSQGQPVLNPLRSVVAECDKEIRQLEDRLGLSPLARLKLGVTFGEMHRSLEGLTGEITADDDDDGDADDDPRVGAG